MRGSLRLRGAHRLPPAARRGRGGAFGSSGAPGGGHGSCSGAFTFSVAYGAQRQHRRSRAAAPSCHGAGRRAASARRRSQVADGERLGSGSALLCRCLVGGCGGGSRRRRLLARLRSALAGRALGDGEVRRREFVCGPSTVEGSTVVGVDRAIEVGDFGLQRGHLLDECFALAEVVDERSTKPGADPYAASWSIVDCTDAPMVRAVTPTEPPILERGLLSLSDEVWEQARHRAAVTVNSRRRRSMMPSKPPGSTRPTRRTSTTSSPSAAEDPNQSSDSRLTSSHWASRPSICHTTNVRYRWHDLQ